MGERERLGGDEIYVYLQQNREGMIEGGEGGGREMRDWPVAIIRGRVSLFKNMALI